MKFARLLLIGLVGIALVGASSNSPPPMPPPLNPANFTHPKENIYFPLRPGTVYFYREVTAEGVFTGRFEVTHQTEMIAGVPARVIHDQEWLDGSLVEDTFDWFASDQFGNVWYFGEDTHEIHNGQVISTAGSWRAGHDGALPGIYMFAQPQVGVEYGEEFFEGVAEDRAKILSVTENVKTSSQWFYPTTTWPFILTLNSPPSTNFVGCVKTRNWNPLEPGPVEYKYYAPGVGTVLEISKDGHDVTRKRLVNITLPS